MYTAVTRIKNKPYIKFYYLNMEGMEKKPTFIQQQHSHIQI